MTHIDRSQFYSGGFFLIRAREPFRGLFDDELLPHKLISLDDSINLRLDVVWTWTHGRSEDAVEFGIPESKWDAFKSWCTDEFQNQIDIGGMFNSRQDVQQFIKLFISDTKDLYLIEAGLPSYLEIENWRHPSKDNYETGIEKRIAQQIPIREDGDILGFEVIGFELHNFSTSWIMNDIHRDMHELYGIKPNQYGLLDDYGDAKKVYGWIAEDEMQGTRAEPIPYDFWLLVSHPLGLG